MRTVLLGRGPRVPTGRAVNIPPNFVPVSFATTADALYDLTFVFDGALGWLYMDQRIFDADDVWGLEITNGGLIKLTEWVAGVGTIRATTAPLAVGAGAHRLQLLVRGNEYHCYLDGVLQWSYVDPTFLYSTIGGSAVIQVDVTGMDVSLALSYPPPVYLVPPA